MKLSRKTRRCWQRMARVRDSFEECVEQQTLAVTWPRRAAIKVASLDQSFRPFCLLLVGRRSVDAIFAVSRVQISRCSSNVVVVVVVVVVVAVVHTGRSGDRVSTCRTHV